MTASDLPPRAASLTPWTPLPAFQATLGGPARLDPVTRPRHESRPAAPHRRPTP